MVVIRMFEERLHEEIKTGEIAGFTHLYCGQEAAAVGVCEQLADDDFSVSTHRGHGHCIAKGCDVKGMMKEIYGRADGLCKGKSGSMHIADLSVGMLGANGIVGAGAPQAVGAALSAKIDGKGKVVAEAGSDIGRQTIKDFIATGVTALLVRSPLTCESTKGVCCACYGRSMATGKTVDLGEAVGIIAAQSIGEPGTQLTMRTFHTGGSASAVDITQGLPRVAELFEARTPKGASPIADATGRVAIDESGAQRKLILTPDNGDDAYSYTILKNAVLLVEDGSHVEVGTQLFVGTLDPKDVLRVRGLREVQTHLVEGVQGVYLSQGVPIHDKHIEVIVRQMLRMVSIVDQGDTELVPGELVDNIRFRAINSDAVARGAKPATARAELLGITKASLATESWLSAASFQETTRVLTQAALERKSDPLIGLKENVIIGKLIPAGTGLAKYRGVDIKANVDEADRKYPQRHFTAGGFSEDAFTYADIESFNSASYDASGFQTDY
jgi:DNA-directed RNA polymerase subunit beta'